MKTKILCVLALLFLMTGVEGQFVPFYDVLYEYFSWFYGLEESTQEGELCLNYIGYEIDGVTTDKRINLRSVSSDTFVVIVKPLGDVLPDVTTTIDIDCDWGVGFSENLSSTPYWADEGFYMNDIALAPRLPTTSGIIEPLTPRDTLFTFYSAVCDISSDSSTDLFITFIPSPSSCLGNQSSQCSTASNPYATPSTALDDLVRASVDIILALFDLAEIVIIFIVLIILPISMITIVWKVILFLTFKWS